MQEAELPEDTAAQYHYPPKQTDPDGFAAIPATSNLPYRSGKASLYEGGTREPGPLTSDGYALLEAMAEFYEPALNQLFQDLTSETGLKMVQLAQPVRLALTGKIRWPDAVGYWIAQCLGAIVAAFLLSYLVGAGTGLGATTGTFTA